MLMVCCLGGLLSALGLVTSLAQCLPSFGDALLLPAAKSNPSVLFGPTLSGTVSRLCGSVTRMAGIWSAICDIDRYG